MMTSKLNKKERRKKRLWDNYSSCPIIHLQPYAKPEGNPTVTTHQNNTENIEN